MSTVSFSLELCQLEWSCHLDTDDSSWLRLEGTKLFSKGMTENQATKERGFGDVLGKKKSYLPRGRHETIGRFMIGLFLTKISDFGSAGQYYWKRFVTNVLMGSFKSHLSERPPRSLRRLT